MPDGTSRFRIGKEPIRHYMGCSTFSNHTVLPEIALAKVREDAPFDKICYIGCGGDHWHRRGDLHRQGLARRQCGRVRAGRHRLNVIQGARMVGADRIVGIDTNPAKRAMAEKFGMTHFINPDEVGRDKVVAAIVDATGGGGRLLLRVHRQRPYDATGARMLPPRLGREHHHRVWQARGRRFPPARSSW